MNKKKAVMGKKQFNKNLIVQFIAEKGMASKLDIAQRFGLSMPTVLQKVKELTDEGFITESGEFQSNGGRKARALSVVQDRYYIVGVNISKHHLELVLIGFNGAIVNKIRERLTFEDTFIYCETVVKQIHTFIDTQISEIDKLIGIGFSIPGIIDREKELLIKSHALDLTNFSLKRFSSLIKYPVKVFFDNDANCAASSEFFNRSGTYVYISLNNTLGGAFIIDNKIYEGNNHKSSEFGHVILVPNGKPCYCGKKGCIDSYCSASQLSSDNLEGFFEKIENENKDSVRIWDEYKENLALVISNIRTIFDSDIVLGGYVGGYLRDFLNELANSSMRYNNFDYDASFLHCSKYTWEASAYGSAIITLRSFYENWK